MALRVKSQCIYLLITYTTEWPSAPILYKEHSPASHMPSCQNSADRTNKEKLANCLWYRIYKRGNNHSTKQVVISWEILMEHFCSLLFVLLSNPIRLNMVTVIKSKTWGTLCISNKPRQYLGYCIYYFFFPKRTKNSHRLLLIKMYAINENLSGPISFVLFLVKHASLSFSSASPQPPPRMWMSPIPPCSSLDGQKERVADFASIKKVYSYSMMVSCFNIKEYYSR